MEQNRANNPVGMGGKYYPRKMAHGWCVAHRITACGATIERFGVKYRTYREAFERADRMNLEEAREAELRAASELPPMHAASPQAGTQAARK
ncbi:hypothetical protein, partial [Bacteroides fluxus]|uniref:hypothetical protein n=1 Tax=Bacteroides fluxus TaxID=626930 RepID=UPI0023A90059